MGVCRWRRLAALVAWGAIFALALMSLAPRPPAPALRPALRQLLQSESTAAPPSSTQPPSLATDARRLDEQQLRADAARRLPALPLEYWHAHKDDKFKFYKKKDCAPFPSLYELEFHNTYWQTLRTSEGVFHLWGAYLDARNSSKLGPAVRLLGVHDRIKPKLATHCQLWFEGREAPVIVRVLEYKYVWNTKWGNYRDRVLQPYLMACVLPADTHDTFPTAVSLVESPCDRASNLIRVYNDPLPANEPRQEFAVCVKGLDFLHEDLSARLVEWIEFVRLMGAHKIFFYQLQLHPNMTRVLDYYQELGVADVTPVTLPGGQPNLPALQHMYLKKKTTHKRQMELIPYNDCLYKHMYRYRWIALLDTDEVIVPMKDPDWSSLMKRILPLSQPFPSKRPRSSYHAANLYFLDSLGASVDDPEVASVPAHLHMLRHVWRTQNFTKPGQYVKAFHETDRVLALHNHFPLLCLGGSCSSYAMETEDARLQHYRADCVSALKTCKELKTDPKRDPAIWRWRDPLERRTDAALRHLGFLPSITTPLPHR